MRRVPSARRAYRGPGGRGRMPGEGRTTWRPPCSRPLCRPFSGCNCVGRTGCSRRGPRPSGHRCDDEADRSPTVLGFAVARCRSGDTRAAPSHSRTTTCGAARFCTVRSGQPAARPATKTLPPVGGRTCGAAAAHPRAVDPPSAHRPVPAARAVPRPGVLGCPLCRTPGRAGAFRLSCAAEGRRRTVRQAVGGPPGSYGDGGPVDGGARRIPGLDE